ncbi:MAG TPA: serine hydrolase domain-containing protein [Nocardia sp.]|uniref:serine hydrolase domain-containing protein n=1 Tax=Nocardia sp. TaxID=1821 RepID=UPI002B4ACE93|nr:serine hydrolase domain-containing protein [Nocardia sp.]HLS79441.1 serine hydrolase domain-containing protein [Nocardia sp.]
MRHIFRILLALALVAFVLVTGAIVALETRRAQIIGFVVENAVRDGVTAVVLRVSDGDGERTWSAGTIEAGSPSPVPEDARFRIGSVTKTFVATVVLQLVDEGRIALDAPVIDYLPTAQDSTVTVRQLLDHTSGLFDYMKLPGMSTNRWRGEDRFDSFTPEDLMAAAGSGAPYFAPGTDFRYWNTNYILLGMLIEAVTADRYGDQIAARILTPLGLDDTTVPGHDPAVPAPALRASRELDGRRTDVTEMNPSLDWAAGEMISTTADLADFLDALLSGELLSPAALAEMTTTIPMGMGFHYGLGIQRFDLPCGGQLWGHGGELLGYLTYAYRSPSGRSMTMAVVSAESDDFLTFAAAATAVFCRA